MFDVEYELCEVVDEINLCEDIIIELIPEIFLELAEQPELSWQEPA